MTKAQKTKLHVILRYGPLYLWEFKIRKILKGFFATIRAQIKKQKIPRRIQQKLHMASLLRSTLPKFKFGVAIGIR